MASVVCGGQVLPDAAARGVLRRSARGGGAATAPLLRALRRRGAQPGPHRPAPGRARRAQEGGPPTALTLLTSTSSYYFHHLLKVVYFKFDGPSRSVVS